MKIVILAGGLSPERDVSLSSASKIAKALIHNGHEICIIDIYEGLDLNEDGLIFTSSLDEVKDYSVAGCSPDIDKEKAESYIGPNVIKCCRMADLVFIALHGDIGENGKIQGILDSYKIRYTGSGYEGCFLSMDKNISKILAVYNGVNTAKWCLNNKDDTLSYPVVIKPSNGGSSIGISIADNDSKYRTAIENAEKYDNNIIIEEKIEGREFSVGILNNKALPVIEIEPKDNQFYNYKNKYQAGLTKETCPADIPEDITLKLQRTALKMHNILRLKYYSRIDFILGNDGKLYFLEANALPGMTPTSLLPQEAAAIGISYEQLCNQIALSAFK